MDATSSISKTPSKSEAKVNESAKGKESLKLRITTNHVDGTSRIVSNNNSLTNNHNNVVVDKDGLKVGSLDKKDVKPNANSSHGGQHKEHRNHSNSTHKLNSSSSSSSSLKTKDSNSKPKENNSLSNSSKDGKHKENNAGSTASKPKDGSKVKDGTNHSHNNNSISKPKVSTSSSKPSVQSKAPSSAVKPKDGNLKPKEASSDSKFKDGSSSKHSSSSTKPKTGSSSTPSTPISKPKTSISTPNSSSTSKSKDSTVKTSLASSSSASSSKPSDKKASSLSAGSNSKSATKSVKKVESSPLKEKHKDKENHEMKDSSRVKSKEENKEKLKETKKENKQIKKEVKESPPAKVNVERYESGESKRISKVKDEPMSDDDDDVPLAVRISELEEKKRKADKRSAADLEDDQPLKKRVKKESSTKRRHVSDDSDDEPISKKIKKEKSKTKVTETTSSTGSPTKRKKKAEEEQDVWKWWEEEKYEDGVKWKTLEHKGPVFAPDYDPLPSSVKFFYNKKEMKLSEPTEEVATFYSKLLDHEYTTKEAFNHNFFKDWRKVMTAPERETITDLKKCDFRHMCNYFVQKTEERKSMTKEEKAVIRKQNEEIQKEYGFCIIDGHKEKIGNFKIEPPGLFRGRGEHPKMGRLKKRILPENVIINCSRKSKIPVAPKGHKWKEVKHDNSVTWLACWQENVQGQTKYVMLNPSSKLKGEKDWQKYEIARKLKVCVDRIRKQYQLDFKSKEMKIRQRAVALYFIDKLALRAGNEKEEGETADTVGCCSLRVEHITLDDEKDGKQHVVSFDFLGKDSIRYVNSVPVEKRVYKNLHIFMENKQPGDDLFDRLNTAVLNKHLNELMEGLTAKVFRTYNASKTLQEQLKLLTEPDDSIAAKLLSYNRANRAVAILCNHQRAVPKTFDKSMENLQGKIQAKKDQVKEAQKEYKAVKKQKGPVAEKKKKAVDRLKEQLVKLELQATDKEENKQIALGTSKLNYLDPRITVAWCKKYEVPIEKVYNRTQRDKFRWAIEMAGPDFVF